MNSRRIAFALCSLTMAASLGLVAFSQIVSGETSDGLSSWVDVQPEIKKITNLSDTQFQDAALDPQCKYQDVHEWGYNPGWGPKLDYSRQGCLVSMASGYYDTNNKSIVAFGTDRLQRLKDPLGDDLRQIVIQPAPNTNRLALVYDSYYPFSNGGAKLKLVDDWAEKFPASVTLDGYSNVERIRSTAYDYELKDSGGNYVEIRTQGLKFSANGEWLHVLLRDKSHAVLNVITHEVVSYSGPTESNWAVRNAVSNNGRYVAITQQQDSFKIYDLNQCDTTTIEFVSRNCHSIELFDRLKDFVGPNAQISIGNVEFVGVGDALDVDVRYSTDDTDWRYETVRLSIPGYVPIKYLAMGDSFSSGEGVYAYRSPTDFYIDDNSYNLCHLSKNSYPYLIQKTQGFDWFNSIACSGAQTGDIGSQDSLGYLVGYSQAKTPQSTASHLSNALENFIPGYAPQIKFNDTYHPTVATISVGGNDFGFGKIIEKCVIGGGDNDILCYFNRDEREKLANSIEDKIPELANLFSKLKASMSGSDPRLYVIGYPEIISPNGICGLNVAMQPSETEFTEHLTQFINQAIKAASTRAGVNYVDVEKAFINNNEDYRLCGNAKQYAVNGLVLKSETSKKPDRIAYSESYHPNQLGQSLLATAILGATSDLTLRSNELNMSAAIPVSSRIKLVGDAQILYPDLKIKLAEDLSPDTLFKEDQVNINLRLKPEDAKPSVNSNFRAEIHSEPTSLGELQFSDNVITGSVVIPSTLSVGYHELHVIYDDIQGNKVDLYKHIYVASSANDFDGDGVNNDSDPCPATAQSGIDQDGDGIDDSCDGEYVKSSSTTNNNNLKEPTNDKSAPDYAQESSIYLSSSTESDIFSTPDAAFQFQSQVKKTYGDNKSISSIKQSQKKQEKYNVIALYLIATLAILSVVVGVLLKKNG